MGQYQQWLHYQEIDRRLHATLAALEQELGQIESNPNGSQLPDMLFANPIIATLSAHIVAGLNGYASPQDSSEENAGQPSNETISAALLHWGELPDFGPPGVQSAQRHDIQPFLSLDHAEIELLPEDMFAFFEEHSQTDPQLELPWWLRKITITSGDDESGKPIDQESIRTNRLVQRWVERWGRQSQGNFTLTNESGGIHHDE